MVKQSVLNYYEQTIKPVMLCFDIGAGKGDMAERFLGWGAKVIALEAHEGLARFLHEKLSLYLANRQVIIIAAGAGNKETLRQFMYSSQLTLSTFSSAWVKSLRELNQIHETRWEQIKMVPTVTLDLIIQKHGIPAVCRIDVTGWEAIALEGLSHAIRHLAFGFSSAIPAEAAKCIDRLQTLGDYHYNYSFTDQPDFELETWISPDDMIEIIQTKLTSGEQSGLIYAELQTG